MLNIVSYRTSWLHDNAWNSLLVSPRSQSSEATNLYIYIYISLSSSSSVLPMGRAFTANSGTKAAVLLKGRSSNTNSGT